MGMKEDAQILATLLKHISSCMNAADIEQLLQDIPVQPPVAVPVRTVREAVAAGDFPPLNADASNELEAGAVTHGPKQSTKCFSRAQLMMEQELRNASCVVE